MSDPAYHPKELRFGEDGTKFYTGLFGVWQLIVALIFTICIVLICSPFVLLGLAELVWVNGMNWRVRWIRREKTESSE